MEFYIPYIASSSFALLVSKGCYNYIYSDKLTNNIIFTPTVQAIIITTYSTTYPTNYYYPTNLIFKDLYHIKFE